MTTETTVSSAAQTTGTEQAGATTQAAAATTETTATATAAAATTATTEVKTEATTEVKADDWRSVIKDPKVKEFTANFTDPAALAEFSFKSRQKLSNAVNIPGKDATPEDVAEFNKKLGVPEKPEGYNYALPEDLVTPEVKDEHQVSVNGFLSAVHKAGATPGVVKAALDWFYEDVRQAKANQDATLKNSVSDGEARLRKEWGQDYDANTEFARREYGRVDPEFAALMDQAELGGVKLRNHPAAMRVFAAYGRMNGESGAQMIVTADEKSQATGRVDELTTLIYEARAKNDVSAANRYERERKDILDRLHPKAA